MSELLIKYEDVPEGAAAATTATCADLQTFASLTNMLLTANEAPRTATFEDDYWVLGEKMHLLPNNPAAQSYGLFSTQQSGADSTFEIPIVLKLELSSLFSTTALSFEFDPVGPTWCTSMDVGWYHDDTLIYSGSYAPDAWQYTIEQAVVNFNKILIVFYAMSAPYRYLKIQSIAYGHTRRFTSKEIRSFRYAPEMDVLCDVLPVNNIEFELKSANASLIFQRKQRLEIYDGDDFLGLFFIDTATKRSAGIYEVKACDLLGLLDMASKCEGGLFDGAAASSVAPRIMGNIPFDLDPALASVPVKGWLPAAGRRESLQQFAFAIGAVVITSGRRYVDIVPLPCSLSSTIGNHRVYADGELEQSSFVTGIEVKTRNYKLDADESELYSEKLSGTVKIEFSEPYGELSVAGGTLVSQSVNHAVLSGTGSTVTLKGTKYRAIESLYSKESPDRNASDADYVVCYSDMTLISSASVNTVLNRCYDRLKRTKKVKTKVLIYGEKVGDFIGVWHDGEVLYGNIVSMDYSISAKTAADITVLVDDEYEVTNEHS